MSPTFHYVCAKCDNERQKYDWWPNWIPGTCPAGATHDWVWQKKDAVAQVEKTLELTEKREQLLVKEIAALEERVRLELPKGTDQSKKATLQLLKQKKGKVESLAKLRAQQDNLEKLQATLEEAAIFKVQVETQVTAAKHLKTHLNHEKTQAELDNIRDVIEHADEIAAMLTQPLGPGVDEDELEAEFEAEKAKLLLAGMKIPRTPLPHKTAELSKSSNADDEDAEALRRLEAELDA